MNEKDLLSAFNILSKLLLNESIQVNNDVKYALDDFFAALNRAENSNVWFTKNNLMLKINQIASVFCEENISRLDSCLNDFKLDCSAKKTLAVIMNDQSPLHNFFDMFWILFSGNIFYGKLPENDKYLMPALANVLTAIDKRFSERIKFPDAVMKNFDGIVVDLNHNGDSKNAYHCYFDKYNHVYKKKKTAVAVLTGNESDNDYKLLAENVFDFFGRSDSSVSTLLVPENFGFASMLKCFSDYEYLKNHARYFNNYEFNKSCCIIENIPYYDNGFLIVRKSDSLFSPVAVLNYREYSSMDDLGALLENISNDVSTVFCKNAFLKESVEFGQSIKLFFREIIDDFEEIKSLICD